MPRCGPLWSTTSNPSRATTDVDFRFGLSVGLGRTVPSRPDCGRDPRPPSGRRSRQAVWPNGFERDHNRVYLLPRVVDIFQQDASMSKPRYSSYPCYLAAGFVFSQLMAKLNIASIKKLSIALTMIEGVVAITKGQTKRGLVLLAAAVLSSRVPGAGTAVSLLIRLIRRLR